MIPPGAAVRLIRVGPVLAAYALYGVAHGRWWLSLPAGLLVAVAALRGIALERSGARLVLSGVAGALMGLAALSIQEVPEGPIPPSVISPLCGAVLALAAFCALARNTLYAGVFAWMLAAMCTHVLVTTGVIASVALLMATTLLGIGVQGRVHRAGAAGVVGYVLSVGALAGSVGLIAEGALALEGTLTLAFYRLLKNMPLPAGLGLQDSVSLSSSSSVDPSPRPLFEVTDPPERLRTLVMDSFDGQTWRASPSLLDMRLRPPRISGPTRTSSILPIESLENHLPVPAGIVRVEGTPVATLGGWMVRGDLNAGVEVKLEYDPSQQLPMELPPGPEHLALPDELRAALIPFARQIIGDAVDPRVIAQRIRNHLHEEFEYSLKTNLRGEGHPLVVLLREKRPAYCVYFAGAMVALLRTQGVAARMVGGFLPEEVNPITGRATVRARDAHAWVEAYLPSEGRFVAFDPTPWRGRDAASQRWGGAWLGPLGDAVRSYLRRAWMEVRQLSAERILAVINTPPGWAAALGMTLWLLRRRRKGTVKRRHQRAAVSSDAALRQAHARYARVLKQRAKLTPLPAETDEELLVRLRRAHGDEAGAAAQQFLDVYRRARFGGSALSPVEIDGAIGALEDALRRQEARDR